MQENESAQPILINNTIFTRKNVFPGEHSEESTKGLLQFTFDAIGSSKLLVDFPVEIGTLKLLRTKWSGQF